MARVLFEKIKVITKLTLRTRNRAYMVLAELKDHNKVHFRIKRYEAKQNRSMTELRYMFVHVRQYNLEFQFLY